MQEARPDVVIIAAALVGGILANSRRPAEFGYVNLMIQTNLIHAAHEIGVRKLVFVGSSCIYPREASVPIEESSLLTGPLESTNEAYAIAKIAGVKMCDWYRAQYGRDFISVMPTNAFGPGDNFDLTSSHMVPGLIHRMHLAKEQGAESVTCWGSGRPLRELIYSEDVADGILHMLQRYSGPGPINIGPGVDHTVRDIAEMIRRTVGYEGRLEWDVSKPDGTYRKVMDVRRALELGWQPKVALEDALARTYRWFLDNRETAMRPRGAAREARA